MKIVFEIKYLRSSVKKTSKETKKLEKTDIDE